MEITPPAIDFLFKQFKKDYDRGYAKRVSLWSQYAERIPSSTETNTYAWLAELPGFREWIGARQIRNIAARTYAITNKDWEDSFAVSRNKIEDDQFGIYSRHSELLGEAASRLWDDLATDALQAGDSATCYDGQFFFDTDHPVDLDDSTKGTYSNLVTATPINVPNLQALKAQMMAYKGESGKSLEILPDVLMVPPQLAGAAFGAATAMTYPSSNAAIPNPNALDVLGALKVIVNPRLSDVPTVYYLMSTTRLKPIIIQVRKEPEIVQRTQPDLDNVFHRKSYEFGADARGNAGYGLPFTAIRASTV